MRSFCIFLMIMVIIQKSLTLSYAQYKPYPPAVADFRQSAEESWEETVSEILEDQRNRLLEEKSQLEKLLVKAKREKEQSNAALYAIQQEINAENKVLNDLVESGVDDLMKATELVRKMIIGGENPKSNRVNLDDANKNEALRENIAIIEKASEDLRTSINCIKRLPCYKNREDRIEETTETNENISSGEEPDDFQIPNFLVPNPNPGVPSVNSSDDSNFWDFIDEDRIEFTKEVNENDENSHENIEGIEKDKFSSESNKSQDEVETESSETTENLTSELQPSENITEAEISDGNSHIHDLYSKLGRAVGKVVKHHVDVHHNKYHADISTDSQRAARAKKLRSIFNEPKGNYE